MQFYNLLLTSKSMSYFRFSLKDTAQTHKAADLCEPQTQKGSNRVFSASIRTLLIINCC